MDPRPLTDSAVAAAPTPADADAAALVDRRGGVLRFRHMLEAVGVGAGARALRWMPRRAAVRIARGLGFVAYYLMPADRRVAVANADLVLGDALTARERRRVARTGFQAFAEAVVGLFWNERLTPETIADYVVFSPTSEAAVREAVAAGRGVIFCSAHYGDWELMQVAVGYYAVPLTVVAEPLRNPRLDAMITRLRGVSGHQVVPPRYAVLKLFKTLKRGGSTGMLIDVNGRRGRGGAWLDFFGLKVFNSTAAVELALRTGAAILFCYARPLPDGRTEMVVESRVELADTGDRAADVETTSQRCLDRCAALIARDPRYWLWSYKRWKRRPTPEQGDYPYYSKYDPKT